MRLLAVFAAALLLAACGSDDGDGGSSATFATAEKGGQTVLVNSSGMTLYALDGEKGGKFICTDAECLAAWAPATEEPSGVDGLGTVKRPDGKQQVTYEDRPLYTFSGDKSKGDVKGEGIKDVGTWHAVTTDGKPSDSGGGGGGGYGGGGY
jgi:predicted lipoprotein with Yx(FWY)xxD motif